MSIKNIVVTAGFQGGTKSISEMKFHPTGKYAL
jgi:hypothetical protein